MFVERVPSGRAHFDHAGSRPAGSRPPTASTGELVRRRLLDLVRRRFDVPITIIRAGARFGKSTLLAQAIRADHPESSSQMLMRQGAAPAT